MNPPLLPERPPHTLAIRVGCALTYHVDEPAPMLLMVQPRLTAGQSLVAQQSSIDTGVKVEHLHDSHGNLVLRLMLLPGANCLRHDAVLFVPDSVDELPTPALAGSAIMAAVLPMDVLRYTLPSRFCESDKLGSRASELFGHQVPGLATARAICDWTYRNIEYRYGSGDPSLSACDAMAGGYGARPHVDGLDTGGLFCIPMGRIPDTEMSEFLYPMLVLWRRDRPTIAGVT